MIKKHNDKVVYCFEKITTEIKTLLERINNSYIQEYINIFYKFFNNELFGDYQGLIIMTRKDLIKNNINTEKLIKDIEENKIDEQKLFNIYISIKIQSVKKRDILYNVYRENTNKNDRNVIKNLIIKLIKLINIYKINNDK